MKLGVMCNAASPRTTKRAATRAAAAAHTHRHLPAVNPTKQGGAPTGMVPARYDLDGPAPAIAHPWHPLTLHDGCCG